MTATSNWTTAEIMQAFALQLRNADPKAWDGFIDALDAYATEVTVQLTEAPAEQILKMQGRAAQLIGLLRTFRECASITTKLPPAP